MISLRSILAIAFACLTLAGCSVLHPVELTVYSPSLEGTPQQADPAPAHAWQLVVAQPRTIAPLDSASILVMPRPGEIESYKGARWRDAAPAMLQDLLLEALHDVGGLRGATAPSSGVHADLALQSILQDFQAEYRGGRVPIVNVRLAFQLVRNSDGSVLQARTFAVEEACTSTQMADVFATFQRATNRLLQEVVAWTVEQGDRAIPSPLTRS